MQQQQFGKLDNWVNFSSCTGDSFKGRRRNGFCSLLSFKGVSQKDLSHVRIGEHSSFSHPWVHGEWRVSEKKFLTPLMLLNSPDQTRKHGVCTIKVLIVNYNLATASVYYLLLLKELGPVISHVVKIFLGNWELFSFYPDMICIHVYWIDYIYPEPIHPLIY